MKSSRREPVLAGVAGVAANVRQAQERDVDAICAIDPVARLEEERRRFIRECVGRGTMFVAEYDRRIAGYAVLEQSFFGRGFIAMLVVHPHHRRRGVGSGLVRHVEGLCTSDRVFTSTNESNLPMQALLEKLGYRRSGVVDDLDPGDPELFYSRETRRQPTRVHRSELARRCTPGRAGDSHGSVQ